MSVHGVLSVWGVDWGLSDRGFSILVAQPLSRRAHDEDSLGNNVLSGLFRT